jgi:hypothetical protein
MPKLASDLLAQARQVNLLEYLKAQGYGPVSGRHTKGLFHSPLREDRNPSFSVTYKDGVWKWVDYGTQEHGDGIDLLIQLHGISFQEAVARLLGQPNRTGSSDPPPNQHSSLTPFQVRRIYREALNRMTPEQEFLIRNYFLERQLAFPERLGIVYIERIVNEQGLTLPFIGIPTPSCHPRLITSLECRAIGGESVDKLYRRRTLGDKALWVIRRPTAGILITESIMDCLAGDQLFQNKTSLCAINSTNNIDLVLPCLRQIRPKTVYLALDHAVSPKSAVPERPKQVDPGPKAQARLKAALCAAGFRTVEVAHHKQARVKDLHKLLLIDPSPISLAEIESLAERYH